MNRYYVYILSNKSGKSVYIGVTNNLERRYFEHMWLDETKFVGKYKLKELIYTEEYSSRSLAIEREKQLKKWSRIKKEVLIATKNPSRKNYLS